MARLIIEVDTKSGEAKLRKLTEETQKFDSASSKLQSTNKNTSESFDAVGKSAGYLKGAIGGLAAALSIGSIIRYADSWTNAESRIRLATNSIDELTSAQAELYDSAQRNRVSYEATAVLFQRMALGTKDLVIEQSKLISITDTINKSVVISGATAASANAAIVQLGQAFSANWQSVGQELASLREQTPRLYQAIIDGMGVTSQEFRKMAEEGRLSSEIIIKALESQASALRDEFGKIVPTVSQSLQVLSNSFGSVVDRVNDSTGATVSLSQSIMYLASSIDKIDSEKIYDLAESIVLLAAPFAAWKAATLAQSAALKAMPAIMGAFEMSAIALTTKISGVTVAQRALNVAMKANPIGLVVTGATALIAVFEGVKKLLERDLPEGFRKLGTETESVNSGITEFSQKIYDSDIKLKQLNNAREIYIKNGYDTKYIDKEIAKTIYEKNDAQEYLNTLIGIYYTTIEKKSNNSISLSKSEQKQIDAITKQYNDLISVASKKSDSDTAYLESLAKQFVELEKQPDSVSKRIEVQKLLIKIQKESMSIDAAITKEIEKRYEIMADKSVDAFNAEKRGIKSSIDYFKKLWTGC